MPNRLGNEALDGLFREARTFPFFREVIFSLAMKTARLSKPKSE